MKRQILGLCLVWCLLALLAVPQAFALRTQLVADGFTEPVLVTHAPGDNARLFVLEQHNAVILIVNPVTGEVNETPFLDINPLASDEGFERGLLGLAFHPDYQTNGYFFVNYTDNIGNTVVARYHVSGNPDVADPGSAAIILYQYQPYANHNAGGLAFGPDGYLYIPLGDGGLREDPENRAQSDSTLLGKILRIDVDGGFPYAIPPDNPFVGPGGMPDEVWAIGLRNPWRWSFDRFTGDLWIADVGQDTLEEVNFQPAASNGGENYGWDCMEGSWCTGSPACVCNAPGLTLPAHEYHHEHHGGGRCTVIGGFVYRGCAMPELQGTYFFGDWCSGEIWSFRYAGNEVTEFTDRTGELDPQRGHIDQVSSFGEDASGEIYLLDYEDGELYKIVPDEFVGDCANPIIVPNVTSFTSTVNTCCGTRDVVSEIGNGCRAPGNASGFDVLYAFELEEPGTVNITVQGPGMSDEQVSVFRICNNPRAQCMASADAFGSTADPETITGLQLRGNRRYFVSVSHAGAECGELTVTISSDVAFSGMSIPSGAEAGTMENVESAVTEYALQGNHPNPFNPSTSITFEMADAGFVSLKVYNVTGQEVAALVNGTQEAGRHSVTFDATGLPSGVYISKLEVNGFTATQKMLLMK